MAVASGVSATAASAVSSGVSQTGVMFAAVGVAFLIYITARGDLAHWLGAFGLAGGQAGAAGAPTPAGTGAATASGQAPVGVPAVGLPQLPALPGLLGAQSLPSGSAAL